MSSKGYEWVQEGNKLIIRNVPIFVECDRGEMSFNATWIKKAMTKAKVRQREGYFPPIHVRHHERVKAHENVQAAGFFKGKRCEAILADLVITDPEVANQVKDSRLPYRSVEIHSPEGDDPGLDSLALLDHDVPFLELPMLELAMSDSNVANATFCYEGQGDTRAMVAFRRNDTAHLLFCEDDMDPDDEKMKSEDDAASRPTDVGLAATPEGAPPAAPEGLPPAEPSQDAVPLEVAPICAAIRSGAISVAGMDEIVEAIKARTGVDPEAAAAIQPDLTLDNPAPAAVPGGESMAAKTDNVAKFAALAGENKALKGRLDAMEADRTRERDVANAFDLLKDRPLGADLEGELTKFHAEHGGVAFAAYVGALDKNVGPTPVGRAAPMESRTAASSEPEKYLDLGADAVDKATQFSAEWRELSNHGHINKKEDRYVAVAMARAGFHLETK
jgi:hypothetical protein